MKLQRTYAHPPDVVWEALTDPRAIRQWWVDTDFRPEPGATFFFQDTPQGSWDGRVEGRVLEVEPGRRVRFSWSGGGHETEVTLPPIDGPPGQAAASWAAWYWASNAMGVFCPRVECRLSAL